MKKEYDFSKAERGRFYKKGIRLRLPIYLDIKLQVILEKIALKKHVEVGKMVQRLVRKEIDTIRQYS